MRDPGPGRSIGGREIWGEMTRKGRAKKEENLRAAGRRSKESLHHVPVLKLELRDDDGGLVNARSRKGRAESGACDECVHVVLFCFVCNTQKCIGVRWLVGWSEIHNLFSSDMIEATLMNEL